MSKAQQQANETITKNTEDGVREDELTADMLPTQVRIKLSLPIVQHEKVIRELTIKRPNLFALRGIKTNLIILGDIPETVKILTKCCEPVINEATAATIDYYDITQKITPALASFLSADPKERKGMITEIESQE